MNEKIKEEEDDGEKERDPLNFYSILTIKYTKEMNSCGWIPPKKKTNIKYSLCIFWLQIHLVWFLIGK